MALLFNKLVARNPLLASGLVGRLVPLVAVSAANWVNIPLMRQQEIKQGIAVETASGEKLGNSSNAAVSAIIQVNYFKCSFFPVLTAIQVVPSRIGMAFPAMFIPPVVMSRLERTATYIKNPWLRAPTTVSILFYVRFVLTRLNN